jgi:hypothetical protein
MEKIDSHWMDFHEIWYLSIFPKHVKKINFLKIWQEERILYTNANRHFLLYFAQFFLELNILRMKVVEKIKTHILCSIIVFRKLYCLLDSVEKHGTGHRWQRGAYALYSGYLRLKTHTKICNTYRFSTAAIVARTRLNVTLYDSTLPVFLLYVNS